IANIGTGVHGMAGNGRLVRNHDFGVADSGNNLLGAVHIGAVIYRQLSQLFQFSPAQVTWIFSITIQNNNFQAGILLQYLIFTTMRQLSLKIASPRATPGKQSMYRNYFFAISLS